jgi:hypothetical protein
LTKTHQRSALSTATLWLLVVLTLVVGAVASVPIASADPSDEVCPGLSAAWDSWSKRADAHNAAPHTFSPSQQAQFDAYNAEKRQLEAERDALNGRQTACDSATKALVPQTPGGPPVKTQAPPTKRAALVKAINDIPSGWQPPVRIPGQRATVPNESPVRPIYDTLRSGNPKSARELGDVLLQGQPRPKPGDADPAYDGGTIQGKAGQPKVSADHIIPLSELVQMPGFTHLTPDQMYLLANTPMNLQWLSWRANQSKGSGAAADLLPKVTEAWAQSQQQLEDSTRTALIDIINKLNAANG